MYTYEECITAVELLIQYGMSYATVIRKLEYRWKRQLLKGERVHSMVKGKPGKQKEDCSMETEVKELREVKENLSSQIDELQREMHNH